MRSMIFFTMRGLDSPVLVLVLVLVRVRVRVLVPRVALFCSSVGIYTTTLHPLGQHTTISKKKEVRMPEQVKKKTPRKKLWP